MNVQTTEQALFRVGTAHSKEYILASSAEEAIEAYYTMAVAELNEGREAADQIAEAQDFRADCPITSVERVAPDVWEVVRKPQRHLATA
jgi:hypothetical protein